MREFLGVMVGGAVGLGLAKLLILQAGDTVATGLAVPVVVFLAAVVGMAIGRALSERTR